jgi:FkbH-like protein
MFLACGFQPLHLGTLLQAHLALRFPAEGAEIQSGPYGNLEGAVSLAAGSDAEAAVVVIEWADLDPRLGLRSTGGWALSIQADILANCRTRFGRLLQKLSAVAERMPVAVIPPTLTPPLLGHTAGWQSSGSELELQQQAATFLAEAGRIERVAVLNSARLARGSAESSRLDALMEWKAGFPYTIQHASEIARQTIQLLFPPSPMKGLITDLDETLWSGIVGEAGVSGVSWTLTEHSQIHGLYQQMLRHLSEMGVMLAVASKNEPAVAQEALQRRDLLIPGESFFPVIANWGNKSDSIAEILRVWNVGAESVVFVDDSAMELEKAGTAFPALACLKFPAGQPAKAPEFLEHLRDLFGKPSIHREDALRHASIRANEAIRAAGPTDEEFLRSLEGKVVFDCRKDPSNRRLLELINKTNQFNLNGVRVTEGEWLQHLADPAGVVMAISYQDKFGPLGTIGVVSGRQTGTELEVSSWVLSCRAFSRRIEHHTLWHLFDSRGVNSIALCARATQRNQPLQQFLELAGATDDGTGMRRLSREVFLQSGYELLHEIAVLEEEKLGQTV